MSFLHQSTTHPLSLLKAYLTAPQILILFSRHIRFSNIIHPKIMKILRHFRIQCDVLKYLGIARSKSDDNQKVACKILQKCCSILFFGLYLGVATLASRQRFEDSKHTITISHSFVDIIESAIETLFIASCLFLPVIRQNNWKSFISFIENLEQKLATKIERKTSVRTTFVAYLALFLLIIVDMSWFLSGPKQFYWYNGTLALNKLYYCGLVQLIHTTTKLVKNFYEILNEKLTTLKSGEDAKIEELKQHYLELQQLVGQINVIFGWQIFLVMLTTVLIVLNVVNDTLYLQKTESTIWKPQMFCDLVCAPVYVVSLYDNVCQKV